MIVGKKTKERNFIVICLDQQTLTSLPFLPRYILRTHTLDPSVCLFQKSIFCFLLGFFFVLSYFLLLFLVCFFVFLIFNNSSGSAVSHIVGSVLARTALRSSCMEKG